MLLPPKHGNRTARQDRRIAEKLVPQGRPSLTSGTNWQSESATTPGSYSVTDVNGSTRLPFMWGVSTYASGDFWGAQLKERNLKLDLKRLT